MTKKGLTILEILIVLAILAILVWAITPLFKISQLESKIAKTNADLDAIMSAVVRFQYDTGTFVNRNEGDSRNINDPYCLADRNNTAKCGNLTGWNGPYLVWRNDPWGHAYKICGNTSNDERNAHSIGPNGTDEDCTKDDICKTIIGEINVAN